MPPSSQPSTPHKVPRGVLAARSSAGLYGLRPLGDRLMDPSEDGRLYSSEQEPPLSKIMRHTPGASCRQIDVKVTTHWPVGPNTGPVLRAKGRRPQAQVSVALRALCEG
jgi:hypothetical protein